MRGQTDLEYAVSQNHATAEDEELACQPNSLDTAPDMPNFIKGVPIIERIQKEGAFSVLLEVVRESNRKRNTLNRELELAHDKAQSEHDFGHAAFIYTLFVHC